MNYEVLSIPPFDRQLKRLVKKYPSLKNELVTLVESLERNPIQGSNIGNNCYKIRIPITSKGKGKSGGARIIANVVIEEATVYLLSIYDKSEKENLTDKELKELLQFVQE